MKTNPLKAVAAIPQASLFAAASTIVLDYVCFLEQNLDGKEMQVVVGGFLMWLRNAFPNMKPNEVAAVMNQFGKWLQVSKRKNMLQSYNRIVEVLDEINSAGQ